MIDQKELAEVQAAIDKAAPAVQAEIAELDVPWSVTRTGHEVALPPAIHSGLFMCPWRGTAVLSTQ